MGKDAEEPPPGDGRADSESEPIEPSPRTGPIRSSSPIWNARQSPVK